MKRNILIVAGVLFMANPPSVLAEEHAVTDMPSHAAAPGTEASTAPNPGMQQPMRGMGMMHQGKGQHGKGQGGM